MREYVHEIVKHLVTLALVAMYLAYISTRFEVIVVSILLLTYARLDNRTLLLAAKADYFMFCITDGLNRVRQGIRDPDYDEKGEAGGMTKMEEAANKLKTYSRIDDAVFFILLLIVAFKILISFI